MLPKQRSGVWPGEGQADTIFFDRRIISGRTVTHILQSRMRDALRKVTWYSLHMTCGIAFFNLSEIKQSCIDPSPYTLCELLKTAFQNIH